MLIDFIDRKTANVYGIYGHLGGGKSLTAVELSVNFLKFGWTVNSNIEIYNLPKSCKGQFNYIPDFETIDFWKLPTGAPRGSSDTFKSVVVIDEAAEFFDQYSGQSVNAKRFLSWLRHSSKRGQFVFLIVQHPDFINANLRKLIHKWIVCDDMEQLRLPIIKMRIPFTRNFVARRLFDKWDNLLSRGFNFASKTDIGRFYDTAQSIAVAGKHTTYKKPEINYSQKDYLLLINIFLLLHLFLIYYWM